MLRDSYRVLALLTALILGGLGCSPWYTDYGIKNDEQLETHAGLHAFSKALRSGSCRTIRAAACDTRKLGAEAVKVVDDLLIAAKEDCSQAKLTAVAKALGRIGEPAMPAIEQIYAIPTYKHHNLAMIAIQAHDKLNPAAIELMRTVLHSREDLDYDAIYWAMEAIKKLGPEAHPLIPDLLPLLAGEWVYDALEALVAIGNPTEAVVEAAEHALNRQEDGYYRELVGTYYDKLSMMYLANKSKNPNTHNKPIPAAAKVPAPVTVGPKQIVAVFDVHDASGRIDRAVLIQLTNYLSTAITATGRYKVIPRDQLRARLIQQKTNSYRKCIDETCQIELGKTLSAQKSLATHLLQVGKRCAITANLYDLKSETAEKGAMVNTGCGQDELLDAMHELVEQLTGS
jgi:hypothetical protein